jgi:hypothetical protein
MTTMKPSHAARLVRVDGRDSNWEGVREVVDMARSLSDNEVTFGPQFSY